MDVYITLNYAQLHEVHITNGAIPFTTQHIPLGKIQVEFQLEHKILLANERKTALRTKRGTQT